MTASLNSSAIGFHPSLDTALDSRTFFNFSHYSAWIFFTRWAHCLHISVGIVESYLEIHRIFCKQILLPFSKSNFFPSWLSHALSWFPSTDAPFDHKFLPLWYQKPLRNPQIIPAEKNEWEREKKKFFLLLIFYVPSSFVMEKK